MKQEILSSAAVSEGAWTQVDGLKSPFTLTVCGFAAGDVAQIWVSNLYDEPAAVTPVAGDGTLQYGGNIITDTGVEITGNYRWVRVRKSTAGGAPATTKARVQGAGRD